MPPIVGQTIGSAVRKSLQSRLRSGFTTREAADALAAWFHSDAPESGSVPWLQVKDRWKVAVGEILLERATPITIRSVWPLIKAQPTYSVQLLPESSFADQLSELLEGLGRHSRVKTVADLNAQIHADPKALWEGTIDRSRLPALSAVVADLLELAAPTEKSEEPVLGSKGVLRVTARVLGTDVDKRNKQTDGRLAVARMIGIGPRSRDAHLGLIRLASDVCTVDDPSCDRCPLQHMCVTSGRIN